MSRVVESHARDFPVVCVGGSAGGLDAYIRLLKNLPADITAKLQAALKKVYDSAGYKEFMTNRGFGMKWAEGADFGKFMDEGDQKMGVAMKAAGLAKS